MLAVVVHGAFGVVLGKDEQETADIARVLDIKMRLRVRFPLVASTGATGIDRSLAARLLREDSGYFSEFHPNAWPRS